MLYSQVRPGCWRLRMKSMNIRSGDRRLFVVFPYLFSADDTRSRQQLRSCWAVIKPDRLHTGTVSVYVSRMRLYNHSRSPHERRSFPAVNSEKKNKAKSNSVGFMSDNTIFGKCRLKQCIVTSIHFYTHQRLIWKYMRGIFVDMKLCLNSLLPPASEHTSMKKM